MQRLLLLGHTETFGVFSTAFWYFFDHISAGFADAPQLNDSDIAWGELTVTCCTHPCLAEAAG
jgi:hypothetical protein